MSRLAEYQTDHLFLLIGSNPLPNYVAAKVLQMDTQHTRIRAVRPGITFHFRIRFENLRDFELGALLWALTLPGSPDKTYRHKLGMGKPLGMGSVRITPKLVLSNRVERYQRLFSADRWHEPERAEPDRDRFIGAFERYVLDRLDPGERGSAASLWPVKRIQMLLRMLEWPGQPSTVTRYLRIEENGRNEYVERPVLPDPSRVRPPATIRSASPPGGSGARRSGRRSRPK